MESNAWEIRLVVPSRIESLSVMNAVAEEVAQQLDFDEEAQNAITISVIEAGTNAIHHGNQEDAAVPTEVLFRRENGALVILIRDQGKGFDLAKVKDPLDRQNIFAESGRGVFILRSFMDEVDFRFDRGTECRLVKYLPRP
ncbi:MAG TPA: ATP-binding protein [bacterium]|nr:ATP-binding protein [bacterium]